MRKARLIKRIRDSQEMLLEEVRGAGKWKRSGSAGGWTVKDHVAHLAEWQDLLGGWLELAALDETPRPAEWAPGTIDRMNAEIYERYRLMTMRGVRAAFTRASARAIAAIDQFTEKELNDPHRFAWWDGEAILTLIESNTYGHIKEHLYMIRALIGNTQ